MGHTLQVSLPAVTNNSTGIASIGNRCRLLVTKHGVDRRVQNEIDLGMKDHLPCGQWCEDHQRSWGVAGGESRFEQDVITYALKHSVLVVAACGNGRK